MTMFTSCHKHHILCYGGYFHSFIIFEKSATQFLESPASNILYEDHDLKTILVCTLLKILKQV